MGIVTPPRASRSGGAHINTRRIMLDELQSNLNHQLYHNYPVKFQKSTCPQNPKMKLLMPPLQPNPRPQKERLLKKRKKKKQPANKLSQILSSTSLITLINKSNPKDGVFTQYSSKNSPTERKKRKYFIYFLIMKKSCHTSSDRIPSLRSSK